MQPSFDCDIWYSHGDMLLHTFASGILPYVQRELERESQMYPTS